MKIPDFVGYPASLIYNAKNLSQTGTGSSLLHKLWAPHHHPHRHTYGQTFPRCKLPSLQQITARQSMSSYTVPHYKLTGTHTIYMHWPLEHLREDPEQRVGFLWDACVTYRRPLTTHCRGWEQGGTGVTTAVAVRRSWSPRSASYCYYGGLWPLRKSMATSCDGGSCRTFCRHLSDHLWALCEKNTFVGRL